MLPSLPLLALQKLSGVLLALQETTGSPTAPAGTPTPVPGFQIRDMVVMLGAFVLIFYFLMWRPQAKERKNREAMFKALKKGDRILLSCGMIGQIAALSEQDVLVKFDDKDPRRLRFRRFAITGVLGADDAPAVEAIEAEAK